MTDSSVPSLSSLAESALEAARAAGGVLLEQWGLIRQVQFKGEIDLVTDGDRRSEATITSFLRARFPDHQILAEEGSTGGDSPEYRWIIDPLDGTTNYAHGYPHFAVSVALEIGGSVVIGAVYDPILDEMFFARSGEGAYLNGRRIGVSAVERLRHGLLSTGFPYDRTLFDASLRRWEHFVRRAQAIRRDGSAALDICYVGAGRFDAFWEDHLFPWDTAAATLIVHEAGGTVTDFVGGEADIYQGDILATNGHLHAAMLRGLAASDRRRRS